MCECCLGVLCVSSESSYGLKQGRLYFLYLCLYSFYVFLFIKWINISCLGACCVSSWRSYGLKQGIHWYFFLFLAVYIDFYALLFMKSINIFLFGSTLCQIRKNIRPKTGNTFLSLFLFILILCLPFHEMHKHLIFEKTLFQRMEELRP